MLDYFLSEDEIKIPISIFSQKTSPLESVVKFLRENKLLTFSKIANLTKRDQRTIWVTYEKASSKIKEKFFVRSNELSFPIEMFSDRRFSIMEILCDNLTQAGFSISQISQLLNKHRNTIWSSLNRYKEKNETLS